VARIARLELRMFCVAALSVVAACGAAVDPTISASTDEPQRAREPLRAAPDLPDGSLAALTAEVRQRLDAALQQARIRADELNRVVQSEETRWNDLIARLEALAR
jgi:hypothetical protein